MKTFKSLEEVESAGLPPGLRAVVRRVVGDILDAHAPYGGYDPESCGPIVLLEEGDVDAALTAALGYHPRDVLVEGCVREGGAFAFCHLHNNEYGVTFIAEDAPWLDPALRARLEAECAGEVAS